jgi:hypothetical protein
VPSLKVHPVTVGIIASGVLLAAATVHQIDVAARHRHPRVLHVTSPAGSGLVDPSRTGR